MNLDLAKDLSRALSGEVRFDAYSRLLYSTDASNYEIEPIGVVLPRNADDVQATLEIAARHNAPVLARGGGSSLAGQAVGHAVVIDFSKYMRRIVEINPEEHTARVEPGVVCDTLNAALKPHGLMFPTEPASSNRATMGGIIANNATGAHSVLYGMTIDHLLSTRAFLADASDYRFTETETHLIHAEPHSSANDLARRVSALVAQCEPLIREHFPKTWRRSSGYSLNYLLPHTQTPSRPSNWYSPDPYPPVTGLNLAKLLAGSEGTLAVMTEATLNLVPRPAHTVLCIAHFDALAAAADATPIILECQPSAVELIDKMMIDLTRSIPGYAPKLTFVEGNPAAILIVEFYGDSESHLISQIDKLETRLRSTGVSHTFFHALTPKQQSDVWGIRKVGLGLLASMRSAAKPTAFMEDVAVPVEKLGGYVRFTERLFSEHGVDSGYYAHASAGCLHIRPILNLRSSADIAKMQAISAEVLNIVITMGGAMSGEHGDGLARSVWNGRLFGPELYHAFRELKHIFDPHNRLNPGKIVDAPGLTENLRYGPGHTTIAVETTLSFEREHGFTAAVEQCNGMGVCRKAEGVMCPSYHATREEEHSTRGRANALRAALT
ncbi:MAG TPA: FAD-binding oxidoreductase, partial [Anaerolineales bacterium]|nr:FAD-binding oxidoreductase [Anaerolineales bacterium]